MVFNEDTHISYYMAVNINTKKLVSFKPFSDLEEERKNEVNKSGCDMAFLAGGKYFLVVYYCWKGIV